MEEPADLHVRITVKLKGPAPHDRDKTTKPRAPPSQAPPCLLTKTARERAQMATTVAVA